MRLESKNLTKRPLGKRVRGLSWRCESGFHQFIKTNTIDGVPQMRMKMKTRAKNRSLGGTCLVRRVQQGRQRTGESVRWGVPSTESPALSLMSFWATKSHPKAGMSRVHALWVKPMSLNPCCRPTLIMQQCLPCISRNSLSQIPSLKKSQSIKLKVL